MYEGEKGVKMMSFVEQEEFGPVNDGQEPEPGVEPCPLQKRLVGVAEKRENAGPVVVDLIQQRRRGALKIAREQRIFFGNITAKCGAGLAKDPPQPLDKDGLIGGQVRDICVRTPFAGDNRPPEDVIRNFPGNLPDSMMLVLQTCSYRRR
jgi:hypothetical protein